VTVVVVVGAAVVVVVVVVFGQHTLPQQPQLHPFPHPQGGGHLYIFLKKKIFNYLTIKFIILMKINYLHAHGCLSHSKFVRTTTLIK
jgi:hypothetical protein